MSSRLPLTLLLAAGGLLAFSAYPEVDALPAPAVQLPWPAGETHRINGGNTYGCGTHGGPGFESNYYAIDFEFAVGQQVAVVTHGTVVAAVDDNRDNGGRGNYLEIDHGNGYRTRYLHLR